MYKGFKEMHIQHIHMNLSEVIQTAAIIASLIIAVGGWIINWRQRVNDKKAKLESTVVIDMMRSAFGKPPVYCLQVRNVGGSTAMLREVKFAEVKSDGKEEEESIVEIRENLNLPLFANQKSFVDVELNPNKLYTISVLYNSGSGEKLLRYKSDKISSNALDHITPVKQMDLD